MSVQLKNSTQNINNYVVRYIKIQINVYIRLIKMTKTIKADTESYMVFIKFSTFKIEKTHYS
jgi:hypothetical protein